MSRLLIFFFLFFTSQVYAKTDTDEYIPPPTIQCACSAGEIVCNSFNHFYLIEQGSCASSTAPQAYQLLSGHSWLGHVFFKYLNAKKETVIIKTGYTFIKANLANSNWKFLQKDYYQCEGANGICPITHLPF